MRDSCILDLLAVCACVGGYGMNRCGRGLTGKT